MLQLVDSWELEVLEKIFGFGRIFNFDGQISIMSEVQISTQVNVERIPEVYMHEYFEGRGCLLGKMQIIRVIFLKQIFHF